MRPRRYWAKDVVYAALRAAAGRRPVRAILMYHEVGGPAGPSVQLFRRQMLELVARFRVVPLRELPEAMSHPGDVACVSVDDGYSSSVEKALPILEEAGVRATFFLPSGLLGKALPTSYGDRVLVDLAGARELVAAAHEVGAHTVTHAPLTRVPPDAAADEVERSKAELEDALGVAVVSFAYPKGDHDGRAKAIVRDAGYRLAVTVREGLLQGSLDRLALPRVLVNETMGMTQFRAKLSPGLELYERIRGRR